MSSHAIQIPRVKISRASQLTENQCLLCVVIIAIAVMAPAMIFGIASGPDLSNHFRFALPFYDALRSGHVYPGWLAESNAGYGDASFRFYPPALYYLLALTRAVTGSWYTGTLLAFTSIFVAGAVGVYLWARTLMSSKDAVWAAVFFTLAPYHLNQFYQATMLAELAATSLLPFAFLFVERVCQKRTRRDVVGLAISYALLLLTHLPLAVIGSLALLLYALVRTPMKFRWTILLRLTSAVLLGLAASSCYWVTVIAELNWIRADNILPDPSVDYRTNFVLSPFSIDNLNVWWMNILLLVSIAMFWPALARYWPSAQGPTTDGGMPQENRALRAPTSLFLLTILMATPLSRPVWSLLRPLQETQFPWRWLAITSMAGPVLLAAALPYLKRLSTGNKRPIVILAAGTMAVSFAFSASHTVREAKWLPPLQFDKTLSEIPGSPGVSQWWPIWVREPLQRMSAPVAAGDRDLTIKSWLPERRAFQLGPGPASEARVRTFFYPLWHAESEGRALPVRPDKDGALLISVPENAVLITLELQEPARVRVAAIVSMLGWILIGALFLWRPTVSSAVTGAC